jgi:large subunit ribosomal protein L5
MATAKSSEKPSAKPSAKSSQKSSPKPSEDHSEQASQSSESAPAGVPRIKVRYIEEVAPKLTKEFGYTSPMQIPRLEKIVINMGVGDAIQNIKLLDGAVDELTAIAGQKAIIKKAKKSVAQFKLRAGMPIACMVTLRGPKMWEFFDRLVTLSLPRVRDFRGVPSKSFDGRGNYTLGLRDQLVFQEIDYSKVEKIKGMNVTFVTTAPNDAEARALLAHLGMPFRK